MPGHISSSFLYIQCNSFLWEPARDAEERQKPNTALTGRHTAHPAYSMASTSNAGNAGCTFLHQNCSNTRASGSAPTALWIFATRTKQMIAWQKDTAMVKDARDAAGKPNVFMSGTAGGFAVTAFRRASQAGALSAEAQWQAAPASLRGQ